jgi:hypothetical protein
LGIPTASEFSSILTKGRGGAESRTRQTYLYKLAGERLTGEVMESFTSPHMERGKLMEEEARSAYSFVTSLDCDTVGFLRRGRAGASPDALIGDNGLLEIKTKLPHLLIEALLKGEFPPEHKAQCQGQLWIAERDWIDLAIYWPGLPIMITRAHRDETFIAELSAAVAQFNEELDRIVTQVAAYGRLEAA